MTFVVATSSLRYWLATSQVSLYAYVSVITSTGQPTVLGEWFMFYNSK
jgi:hypothetical protein